MRHGNYDVFALPAGFRPAKLAHAAGVDQAAGGSETATPIDVGADGSVTASVVAPADSAALDGITFRCGPSGAGGCP